MTSLTELLKVIIWPVTLLILLLVYRKGIPGLLSGIAGRISKVEFGGMSLELAKAKSFSPDWSKFPNAMDLRNNATSMQVNDSTAGTFITQLEQDGGADYAIIHLGQENEWLTSRLFIIAIMYARMKGIRCFVFLEQNADTANKFVGWAFPEDIHYAFARHYAWLEQGFARAYSETMNSPNNFIIVSDEGKIGVSGFGMNAGITLLSSYLRHIQQNFVPPAIPADGEWTLLDAPSQTFEHGIWLNKILLETILGDHLHTSSLPLSDLRMKEPKDQFRLYLSMSERFIAVTGADQRFDYLIDRQVLLEQQAAGAMS